MRTLSVILFAQLQFYLTDGQTLTCLVNKQNVNCPPKACRGDLVTLTYNASDAAGNSLWRFPNGTCSNATPPDAIILIQGQGTSCSGQNGICGAFTAANNNGDMGLCLVSTLTARTASIVQSLVMIKVGTVTVAGIENVTNSTELIIIEAPGYPNISVTSGLTNLIITWTASPSGGPPDHYNVALLNGSAAVYDQNNITANQSVIWNLSSNAFYEVHVTAINCATNKITANFPAYTLSNPPSNIKALKQEVNSSGVNFSVSWSHIGGSVSKYLISLECCSAVTLVATVDTYCRDVACTYSQYLALTNITYITISSVNPGGVGPESEPIQVEKIINGGPKLIYIIVIAVVLLLPVLGTAWLYLQCKKKLCFCTSLQRSTDTMPMGGIIQNSSNASPKGASNNSATATDAEVVIFEQIDKPDALHNNGGNNYKIMVYNPGKVTVEVMSGEVVTDLTYTQCNMGVSDAEYNYITDRFSRTMPNAQILKVSYVENWGQFSTYLERRQLIKEHCPELNEKIMFHGTFQHPTEHLAKGDGYSDMEQGCWGNGWYFTDSAEYAAHYASGIESEKEITLALVIIGNSYKCNNDERFKEAPVIPNTERKYDSCSGMKRSDRIANMSGYCCVVYSKEQTCPLYIITYRK